jgi:putative endonuclease
MYIVYIIKSLYDHSYYIGYTSNLDRRLEDHNSGRSRYTKKKVPWVLAYIEKYSTKTEAIKRERFLKNQKNKRFYENLIES